MALISIFPRPEPGEAEEPSQNPPLPHVTSRAESLHRLQIGLSGIAGMLLLVGLAQVIFDKAQESEAAAVPAAAATVTPSDTPTVQNDPLAEAGVVPDLPSEPAQSRAQEPAVMPEQGRASPNR